jgi:hypothetical protein
MSPLYSAAAHCSIKAGSASSHGGRRTHRWTGGSSGSPNIEKISGVRNETTSVISVPRSASRSSPAATQAAPVVLPHVDSEDELTVGMRRQKPPVHISGPSMMNAPLSWWPWYHSISGGIAYFASSPASPRLPRPHRSPTRSRTAPPACARHVVEPRTALARFRQTALDRRARAAGHCWPTRPWYPGSRPPGALRSRGRLAAPAQRAARPGRVWSTATKASSMPSCAS